MGAGSTFAAESSTFRDPHTNASVRQVTNAPAIHHHPFYYLPCMDRQMRRLIFVSLRTGRPEIFAEDLESGVLIQLTDRGDIGEWSVHPSYDGKYVYFTAAGGAWRVDIETQREEELVNFASAMRGAGMVGAGMGTTSVSTDDRYWAVPVRVRKDRMRLALIDTGTGKWEFIAEHSSIGHPQFHPDDPSLLRFAGPWHSRIWVTRRDGTDMRLLYQRQTAADGGHYQWIVHEVWRPGSREIITADWPHGCIGIDADTGETRTVCAFNAWHPSINDQGTQMCTDTNFPDRGLMLFDPLNAVGTPKLLCKSEASSVGNHWDTQHCPYDDGPIHVYAPQHTHPHPRFTPDGKQVVFTSDRSGHAQVYVVDLPTQGVSDSS